MTSKQVFEAILIELNKKQAPSLLLEDFNYFINKGILQYINKVYNAYDINQQKTDDLRVLKATAVLTPSLQNVYPPVTDGISSNPLFGNTYNVNLPDDYFHILNCLVEYTVKNNTNWCDNGNTVQFGATRLTSDMYSQIINNYYMKPSYKRPYYFINNVNLTNVYPTTTNQELIPYATHKFKIDEDVAEDSYINFNGILYTAKASPSGDYQFAANVQSLMSLYSKLTTSTNATINLCNFKISPDGTILTIFAPNDFAIVSSFNGTVTYTKTEQKTAPNRYGNRSKVNMEIRYGRKDYKVYELARVYVDYLKTPEYIRLTQDQVDEIEDISQVLEFPDYVVQEIINEITKLIMENASDPRLQSHIPINQSIAQPQQPQQATR